MKLYSFTTVKDEADIIESFVRYNMNILDGMVISNNGSNDNTLEILYKLKSEGYNLDIIEDKSATFNQYVRRNELLQYTIENYKPDFIFPLDADEFIATNKKCNPREIIENLDNDKLYLYKMENYVLTKTVIKIYLYQLESLKLERLVMITITFINVLFLKMFIHIQKE